METRLRLSWPIAFCDFACLWKVVPGIIWIMPANNPFSALPYVAMVVSAFILLFGLIGVATARDPDASKWGQGCVMVISCLMILAALLFGGCAVVWLRQN